MEENEMIRVARHRSIAVGDRDAGEYSVTFAVDGLVHDCILSISDNYKGEDIPKQIEDKIKWSVGEGAKILDYVLME